MPSANKYTELSDPDLLDAWRADDRGARDELILRYFIPLQRFFGTRLEDPVVCADLVQATILALIYALDRHGCTSVRSYVFKIASNKLNGHLREQYQLRGNQAEFDSSRISIVEIYGRTFSSVIRNGQRSEQLRRLMEELPIDDQSMLQLFYWEELSASEVGEVFELKQDAVRAKLYRVRKLLRSKFDADDEALIGRLKAARDDCV